MAEASLRLTDITKSYPGVLALNRVSFECRPGEIHAVLGENGSGKSTLLGIASGATVADSGAIEIMGQPLAAPDPLLARRLGLATVYQDDSLVRELTVADNLVLAVADRSPRGDARDWAAGLLAPYDLDISPDVLVGQLTPSQRQFLEIVKALSSKPKVLLLDEPTSSLDLSGVEKLSNIIRQISAAGTAVVYVSHRLPEILALAQRVTILRDGVGQGTYDVSSDLSEHDLISLMVGRPIEAEYPPSLADGEEPRTVLSVRGLSGDRFHDVSLEVRAGEILGFAGAEGNGQRDTIRALGGLIEASGELTCGGQPVPMTGPRAALAAGIISISGDRSQESIFPALGVRENMTVQVLQKFASRGLVSGQREREAASAIVDQLHIVTPTLEQAISGLSGGNQQKTVLGRTFLHEAKVVLIDEPTQGVDAKARFDIYRAIRDRTEAGLACVVNSSDALELAGICDRVLVFSRGRVIRELTGDEVSEENIVSSFLTSKGGAATAAASEAPTAGGPLLGALKEMLAAGRTKWWTPLALLAVLTVIVALYAALQSDVFLSPLNIRHILLATAPLALVTMAQFNVLMVRGFDISVGALMSLIVVLASYVIADTAGPALVIVGIIVCLLAGVIAGLVNGSFVRLIGINPVITTIATLSIFQGIALYGRPSPFGTINTGFLDILRLRLGFVPISFFAIIAVAIVGDFWLYGTRSGLKLRAVGFRDEAAKRNGVRLNLVYLRAYLLSGVLAAIAGLFLASEVGFGHPTVGSSYTLTSIAAAVLGGAALTGGRGSFVAAALGALFFTMILNIITLLGLNTGAGVIISGALTLFAVLIYSGWQPIVRLWSWVKNHARTPQAVPTQ